MATFVKTRAYVQRRKELGYDKTVDLPFDESPGL
jgi:hypothetical protein